MLKVFSFLVVVFCSMCFFCTFLWWKIKTTVAHQFVLSAFVVFFYINVSFLNSAVSSFLRRYGFSKHSKQDKVSRENTWRRRKAFFQSPMPFTGHFSPVSPPTGWRPEGLIGCRYTGHAPWDDRDIRGGGTGGSRGGEGLHTSRTSRSQELSHAQYRTGMQEFQHSRAMCRHILLSITEKLVERAGNSASLSQLLDFIQLHNSNTWPLTINDISCAQTYLST